MIQTEPIYKFGDALRASITLSGDSLKDVAALTNVTVQALTAYLHGAEVPYSSLVALVNRYPKLMLAILADGDAYPKAKTR